MSDTNPLKTPKNEDSFAVGCLALILISVVIFVMIISNSSGTYTQTNPDYLKSTHDIATDRFGETYSIADTERKLSEIHRTIEAEPNEFKKAYLQGIEKALNEEWSRVKFKNSRSLDYETDHKTEARKSPTDTLSTTVDNIAKIKMNMADEDGWYPLHQAANEGNTERIAACLKYNLDINKRGKEGFTPLYLAAINGHIDATKLLLKSGAKLNLKPTGGKFMGIPILVASKSNQNILELLLTNGANINETFYSGSTLLLGAISLGDDKLAVFLINNSADITIANDDGFTALHVAKSEAIANLLIKKGANVNVASKVGLTPLHTAAITGDKSIVLLLLDHNAKINCTATNGATPLDSAILKANSEIVNILKSRGGLSSVDLKSEDQTKTPPIPREKPHGDEYERFKILMVNARLCCDKGNIKAALRLVDSALKLFPDDQTAIDLKQEIENK